MVGAPPVVRLITQLERCLMIFRNGAKASGLWSGWPVLGLRACRCTIAAPASAASTAASAISCGVTGSALDIDGVWIAPVTAQVMMTLRAMLPSFGLGFLLLRCLVRGQRCQPFIAPLRQCGNAVTRRLVRPGCDHLVDVRALIDVRASRRRGQFLVEPRVARTIVGNPAGRVELDGF